MLFLTIINNFCLSRLIEILIAIIFYCFKIIAIIFNPKKAHGYILRSALYCFSSSSSIIFQLLKLSIALRKMQLQSERSLQDVNLLCQDVFIQGASRCFLSDPLQKQWPSESVRLYTNHSSGQRPATQKISLYENP